MSGIHNISAHETQRQKRYERHYHALTLPIPNGLIDQTGAGGEADGTGRAVSAGPVGAVDAANANLSGVDGHVLPALGIAGLDVLGGGLEVFELLTDEGKAGGYVGGVVLVGHGDWQVSVRGGSTDGGGKLITGGRLMFHA